VDLLKRVNRIKSDKPFVVDFGSRKPMAKENKMPCITGSRGAECSYYITTLKRSITLRELMRAQGMNPERIRQVTSNRVLGRAVGNAFTQPVIEELLKNLLPSVGLAPPFNAMYGGA